MRRRCNERNKGPNGYAFCVYAEAWKRVEHEGTTKVLLWGRSHVRGSKCKIRLIGEREIIR